MVAIAPLSWSKAQEWLTKIENEVDQRDKKKTEKTGEWSRYKLRIMENDALRHLEFLLVYYSVQAIHADHKRIGLISHIDACFSRTLLCSFFAPKTLMQTCNFCVIKGIDELGAMVSVRVMRLNGFVVLALPLRIPQIFLLLVLRHVRSIGTTSCTRCSGSSS
jgi:hypothetical protein